LILVEFYSQFSPHLDFTTMMKILGFFTTTVFAEKQNIVELAESVADLSTLVAAVVAADLVDVLISPGPFTVFAPANVGFEALPQGTLDSLMKPENKNQLVEILTYHVLPEKVLSKHLTNFQSVNTVSGKIVNIYRNGVEGVRLVAPDSSDAKFVMVADNLATNGVVHIIDGVLIPPQDSHSAGGVRSALTGNWTQLSNGPWHKSEGLMVSSVGDRMILTGGRSHLGTVFQGGEDYYWTTDGINWTHGPEDTKWGKRAYHIMIGPNEDGCIFLMGGQTFNHFYNDVWRSCDAGDTWDEIVPDGEAPWGARAGLGGTMHNGKLFIAGGCFDKVDFDPGFFREFYGDVWSSEDGKTWTLETESPGWIGRSGGRLVSFQGKLFMVAGEIGFTDNTQLADVWSSSDDGKTWDLVTEHPAYTPRSGHGVVTYGGYMILIAGWPQLSDMWYTTDGADWKLTTGLPWNCDSMHCGKYDFWPVVHKNKLYLFGGSGTESTFGKLYKETWSLDLPMLASGWSTPASDVLV